MTTLPAPPSSLVAVTPDDDSYRFLRSTYTTRHSPSLILIPRSNAEVAQALSYAGASELPLSVRSGGHGLSGSSSNDGGIVIDLGALNGVTILDQTTRLVRVGAGARWAHVASELTQRALAISSGDHGNVGVGGLATAGGIGWLVRSYGLTIDHVWAATVVLPSGEVVRADPTEPDLFWAVRGAGSYVGVVTDLEIHAMHLPGVQVGRVVIEVDEEGTALERWSRFMADAPRELTMSGILTAAGVSGRPVLALTAVVASLDPPVASASLAPLLGGRGFRGIAYGGSTVAAGYADLVPRGHLHPNVGQQPSTTTNALLGGLTPEAARTLVEIARHPSTPLLQVRAIGGAANDIDPGATAFAHRSAQVLVTASTFAPRGRDELEAATQALWAHAVGAYRNFESHPTPATFERAFPGATGDRVRDLAKRYDPAGLLRRSGAP